MLSRVWVERAGSESAVFGGARPLSDLVDMPIDTVYMSMDMLCHATLCLCPVAPSHSPSPFLSLRRPIAPSSRMASLSLHLAHLSSGYSRLLCPLFFSFPRNLPHLAPSLFRPQLLSSPPSVRLASSNGPLGPATVPVCWLENAMVVVTAAVVVVRDAGGDAGVVVGGRPVRREGKE